MRNHFALGSLTMALSTGEKFLYGLRVKPSNHHSAENRPLFDQRGYCHGYVTRVTFQEARAAEDGRTYGPSYKWELVCPGTIKAFGRMYWTWTRQRPPKPRETHSAFGELCRRLRLVEDTVVPVLDKDIDVSKAVGLGVVYTLKRQGGVYLVDGASIALEAGHADQLELWGKP
jgi:hypothetical protein